MAKGITTDGGVTIGLDLGDKHSEACVLDAAGEELERFRHRSFRLWHNASTGRAFQPAVKCAAAEPLVHWVARR